jgi:predicted nucleotidyltransferase
MIHYYLAKAMCLEYYRYPLLLEKQQHHHQNLQQCLTNRYHPNHHRHHQQRLSLKILNLIQQNQHQKLRHFHRRQR